MMDGTAAVVWDLLATPLEQSELVSALGTGFGVDVARVQAEVTPFLRELWSAGALQRT